MTKPPILSDLKLPDGITRPYRAKPNDFRPTYIERGREGLEDHYGTNWRVVARWVWQEEQERPGLKQERAAFVAARRIERRERAKRYVLGRTLTAVKPGLIEG